MTNINSKTLCGAASTSITPTYNAVSAGYKMRTDNMTGVNDVCMATALCIKSKNKKIILVSVDHLGFDKTMVDEIRQQLHKISDYQNAGLLLCSTHTHSGGGGYLNITGTGGAIAGKFEPSLRQYYIDRTVEAIKMAIHNIKPAKIGIGKINTSGINTYRRTCPGTVELNKTITIWKITDDRENILAILYNFPIHPTVLPYQNTLFSSDFIGCVRDKLQKKYSSNCHVLFFNGAQGDVDPNIAQFTNLSNSYRERERIGTKITSKIIKACSYIDMKIDFNFELHSLKYSFKVKPSITNNTLPIDYYKSELNILTINNEYLFWGIPGEISCVYDKILQNIAKTNGFTNSAVFGLCNDAHGYILPPKVWEIPSSSSEKSFGGRNYAPLLIRYCKDLLEASLTIPTAKAGGFTKI